jgi:L-glutamine:2-deoxy-scyllo-inosose/3-amino-2,3-dideoxy-scyllo-inosose aminotransferase
VSELAILGGNPVRTRKWEPWPRVDEETIRSVEEVLRGDRWTVRGLWNGRAPLEQTFAEEFARYIGVRRCIATDHGSSALLLALEALDVGYGDEVIVPALTWVATGSSVIVANAIPVFVDVDPETGCMSPEAFAAAITPRTRAAIPVHLHCTMADMDRIGEVAATHGVDIIEDCAQAHGSRWGERMAGSIGRLGAFSMQQSKTLTAGEGGAVTTDDEVLYGRLEQLRADSRRYPAEPRVGKEYLEWAGEVMGSNRCLSELQAAVLLGGLRRLDEQTEVRAGNARILDKMLAGLGLEPIRHSPRLTRQAVYEYAVRCPPELLRGADPDRFCQAISRELGLNVYRTDPPLHRNALYCPLSRRRFAFSEEHKRRLAVDGLSFPVAERLHRELVLFHHASLLGPEKDMRDIAAAFEKVLRHVEELADG